MEIFFRRGRKEDPWNMHSLQMVTDGGKLYPKKKVKQ